VTVSDCEASARVMRRGEVRFALIVMVDAASLKPAALTVSL